MRAQVVPAIGPIWFHPLRDTWACVGPVLGKERAMIALARRIAVILHRKSKDDTDFRFHPSGLVAG
jgi:hypothetical protein